MTQTELASVLDMSKVALGGLLDRLEDNGFIVRVPDQADRRIRRVNLSKAGEALLSTIQARAEKLNRQMLQDYSDDEIRIVEEMLHGLKTRLMEMNEEMRGEPLLHASEEDIFE